MLKTLFSRVMWMARGTSMLLGLAVMLDLVFGVTTMALAAVPGDPFKLGKSNAINKISTLVGSASTALLKVDNNGTGVALDLETQAGTAPMTVNSETKVDNLNSDQVDGKDSTDFYAAGSKVADADQVDGKDSTEFLASECRSGFTAFAGGRLCVSSALQPATRGFEAISTCWGMGARVGNSNDVMLTFTESSFNYFGGIQTGWLADDHGDDSWGTWNVRTPSPNFDGISANVLTGPPLPYRCVY